MARGLGIAQSFTQINGSPQYLGTIQSTGTNVISNISGTLKKGMQLLVQPDADGYISPANHASAPVAPNVTNSTINGLLIVADQKYYINLAVDDAPYALNGQAFLQWISASGTTNLKVWRMR